MQMMLWTAALAVGAIGRAGLTKLLALALVGILLMGMVAPQPAYAQGGVAFWNHRNPQRLEAARRLPFKTSSTT